MVVSKESDIWQKHNLKKKKPVLQTLRKWNFHLSENKVKNWEKGQKEKTSFLTKREPNAKEQTITREKIENIIQC